MTDLLTPQQQKARLYYQQNRERMIESANQYRLRNWDKCKEYQADYFQRYKKTAKYKENIEKRQLIRQQQSVERNRKRAEEEAKRQEEERRRQPLPLVIEKPKLSEPSDAGLTQPQPPFFTVKFL